MLGFYNVSVILTYVSLIFATFGLSFALSDAPHSFFAALLCLMLSGICDMFDGAVAQRCRRSEEEKLFGIQIDSLCDLVAFGALPALLTVRIADGSTLSKVAAALILLSSVIRLGFFNVQEIVRDRSERRESYLGLPVTMTAILFPALLLLNLVFELPFALYAPIALIVLAALEVTAFSLPKPHGKGKLLILLLGIAVFVLVCLFGTKFVL